MFLHKVSTRVVCVNGKHPYDILESIAGEPLSLLRSKVTWRDAWRDANGRNMGYLPFDRKCRKFRMEGKW